MNCQLYGSNNDDNYGLDDLDNLSHEQSSVNNFNDEEQLQYYTNQNLVEDGEEEIYEDDDQFEKDSGNTLEEFHQNGGLSDGLEKEEVVSPLYNSQQADLIDGVGENLQDEDELPFLTSDSKSKIFHIIVNKT